MGSVTVLLPIGTVSTPNMREHWTVRSRRTRMQRGLARNLVERDTKSAVRWLVPERVTLTRIAPRALDGDNLQGALKAIRDGVADALGIDDGDPSISWHYAQRKGKPREYAVEVRIE